MLLIPSFVYINLIVSYLLQKYVLHKLIKEMRTTAMKGKRGYLLWISSLKSKYSYEIISHGNGKTTSL